MTREAKIGMLTGLVVIVLIGVLLSQYLGGGVSAGAGGGGTATGRMAALPVGAGYRQQVMDPIVVPGMSRGDAGADAVAPIVTSFGDVPAAYASDAQPAGPRTTPAVMPQPVGPAPMEMSMTAGDVPTFSVPDRAASPSRPMVAATGQEYTIKPNDTLTKIAKAFFGSAKTSDIQRIVAANPGKLKDSSSVLMAGKTLIIPVAPVASPIRSAGPAADRPIGAPAGLHVPIPGPLGRPEARATDAPQGEMTRRVTATYVVQSGDTLQKIARKISPQHPNEVVQKIMAANGIRDPHALQAGTRLKVPA